MEYYLNHHLNHLVIDGSKIVLKSLDSSVTDPDMIIAATGKPEKQVPAGYPGLVM